MEVTLIDTKKPRCPLGSLLKEGTLGTCPDCGSTEKRKWFGLGSKIGCIQAGCDNYYNKEAMCKNCYYDINGWCYNDNRIGVVDVKGKCNKWVDKTEVDILNKVW